MGTQWVGLHDNALFQQMDVMFDQFNAATAYSGPAAIRLLRASCGQSPHAQLYNTAPKGCLLMTQLAQLGFSNEVMLNHTGLFEGFLDEVQAQGGLPAPAVDTRGLPRAWVGFDGSPILHDGQVLNAWWAHRLKLPSERVALYYNSISLHDGNRTLAADGSTHSADYAPRAQALIDDLVGFLKQLQRSGRRVVVVIVPEHGAALQGDRMQIAGMREIPSPSITRVPVGIKMVNMGQAPAGGPLHVAQPSSFLALATLVQRLYAAPLADQQAVDWPALLNALPVTPAVSENAGTVVLDYAGKPYVRIKENSQWLPYPQPLR